MSNQIQETAPTQAQRDVDDVFEIVDALQDELEDVRSENRELRDRVDELEQQVTVEVRADEGHDVDDIWIADRPIGKMVRDNRERTRPLDKVDLYELDDRVIAIERGEVDPGELVANSSASIDPSELLPLHNKYLMATNLEPDEHDLSENQEIAARLFPFLGQYAFSNEGQMILPSTKVADIIEREIATPELAKRLDVESPNNNTIRRAMEFAARFGKEIVEFDRSQKTNRLVIDRDEWVEYTQHVSEVAGGDYDAVTTANEAVKTENTADEDVEKELDRLTQT